MICFQTVFVRASRRWSLLFLASLSFFISLLLTPQGVWAQSSEGDLVKTVMLALNSFKTLQGSFVQISPRGGAQKGVFFLERPGKMRFEYAPPSSTLLISDGTWVSVENKDRHTADQYPFSTTPLKFILGKQVDFVQDAHLLEVMERDGIIWITLEAKERLIPGKLSLGFSRSENALKQWIVTDAQNRKTIVELSGLEANRPVSPHLFRVHSRKSLDSARDH